MAVLHKVDGSWVKGTELANDGMIPPEIMAQAIRRDREARRPLPEKTPAELCESIQDMLVRKRRFVGICWRLRREHRATLARLRALETPPKSKAEHYDREMRERLRRDHYDHQHYWRQIRDCVAGIAKARGDLLNTLRRAA